MNWRTGFVSWVNSIPAVIWSGAIGAVLASGISYFGVRSANSSSLKRLHEQHKYDADEAIKQREHDANQKGEDRKAAIRREVYTKAVEEVHAVLGVIGSFPERPLSKRREDADGLQVFLKANAKVWLVAESEAAHLSRELTNLTSELYLNALLAAHPLRVALEPLQDIADQITHMESEVRRIDVRIAEAKEGRSDLKTQEAMVNSWTDANGYLKSLKAERERVLSQYGPQRLAIAKAVFDDMRPMQRTIVKLVSSLRKELHLLPDEEQFLLQLDEMEARALAALDRAYGVNLEGT